MAVSKFDVQNWIEDEITKFYRAAVRDYISKSADKFQGFVSVDKLGKIFDAQHNIGKLQESVARYITMLENPRDCAFIEEALTNQQSVHKQSVEKFKQILKNIAGGYMNNIREVVERAYENIRNNNIQKEILGDTSGGEWVLGDVRVASSDPHKNNRRVAFIDLEKKVPVTTAVPSFFSANAPQKIVQRETTVYKPADLAVDAFLTGAKESVMKTLDEKLLQGKSPIRLPTYRILDCARQYGFMQYLPHGEKDYVDPTEKQVESASFTYGIYGALSILFGINDRHMENMIISGREPYMLDLETSFFVFSPGSGRLSGTHLLDKEWGALTPMQAILCLQENPDCGRVINSLFATPQGGWIPFDKSNFILGFEHGLKLIAENADKFKNDIDAKLSNHTVRILPLASTNFSPAADDFAVSTLRGVAQSQKLKQAVFNNLRMAFADKSDNTKTPDHAWKIRVWGLLLLNIDMMDKDFNRGDIPYFSLDLTTGKMCDSDGIELGYSDTKFSKIRQDILAILAEKLNGYTYTVFRDGHEETIAVSAVAPGERDALMGQFAREVDLTIEQIKAGLAKKPLPPADIIKDMLAKHAQEYKKSGSKVEKTSLYGGTFPGMHGDITTMSNVNYINNSFDLLEKMSEPVEMPTSAVTTGFHCLMLLVPVFISSYFINSN